MVDIHGIWSLIATDWHKIGVVVLILKEFKIFYHLWKIMKVLGGTIFGMRQKENRSILWKKLKSFYKEPRWLGKIVPKGSYDVKEFKHAFWNVSSKDVRSLACLNQYADTANFVSQPHLNPTRKGLLIDHVLENRLIKLGCAEYLTIGGGLGVGVYQVVTLTHTGRLIIGFFQEHIQKYGKYVCVRTEPLNPGLKVFPAKYPIGS